MGYSFHVGSPVNLSIKKKNQSSDLETLPQLNPSIKKKNQSSALETLPLISIFFLERQPALREGLGCKRNWDMGGAGRGRSWDVGGS